MRGAVIVHGSFNQRLAQHLRELATYGDLRCRDKRGRASPHRYLAAAAYQRKRIFGRAPAARLLLVRSLARSRTRRSRNRDQFAAPIRSRFAARVLIT